MSRPFRLLAAALAVGLLQIAVFGWSIWSRAAILRDGTEIVLEVEPVDPRDLLRGDYVVLAYSISQIPERLVENPADRRAGRMDVHVRLAPREDGRLAATAARLATPFATQPEAGQIDLRGVATLGGDLPRILSVRYGIERYYVPEGEGRAIEAAIADRIHQVRLAVGADGTARIKTLLAHGEPVYEEPLY